MRSIRSSSQLGRHKFGRGRIAQGTLTIVVGLLFFGLFVVGVTLFRGTDKQVDESSTIASILTPDPISTGSGVGLLRGREAPLRHVVSQQELGEATRSVFNERLSVVVRHQAFEVDNAVFFYEVWLVRKLPFNFVSIGEMIPQDTGGYALSWESAGEQNYLDYNRVIVTRETRGASPDPETHILEGEFE